MPCPKRCARGSPKKVRHSSGPTDCSTGVRGSSTDSTTSPHVESTSCGRTSTPTPNADQGPGDRFRRVQPSTELTAQPPVVPPPAAQRRPVTTEHHGRTRVDDYEWLRDKGAPEVLAHLEAENEYTQAQTAHLADLRQTIFDEIKARTRETDLSVPTRNRGHWYYGRSFEGKEYGASCRVPVTDPDDWTPPKPAEDSAPDQPALPGEELLLDLDALAEGHEFFSLGGSSVSPDAHPARLLDRRGRRRALHDPGPRHRQPRAPPRRDPRRHRRRHVGPVGPAPLLHDRRRVVALGQDLAAHARHRPGGRRARPPRAGRPVLRGRGPQPQRPVRHHRGRVQDHLGVPLPRLPGPRRRLPGVQPA